MFCIVIILSTRSFYPVKSLNPKPPQYASESCDRLVSVSCTYLTPLLRKLDRLVRVSQTTSDPEAVQSDLLVIMSEAYDVKQIHNLTPCRRPSPDTYVTPLGDQPIRNECWQLTVSACTNLYK